MIYISFFLIFFIACTISGLVGFGSNIIALPFLSLFLDIKIIVPVLLLTAVLNGTPRLIKHYQNINMKCYFTILPLALGGSLLGVQLGTVLHEGWMKLFLAFLMLLIAGKGLLEFYGFFKIKEQEKMNYLLLIFPFMAGVMQAAFACGGPLYNMYIIMNLKEKEEIRTTQYAISITTSIVAILQYLCAGAYQREVLNYIFLMIPAVIFAYFISEMIFNKINSSQFMKIVYVILIIAGVITGWQAIRIF